VRKFIAGLGVVIGALIAPALASAATGGTYAASFDFNSTSPTFNPAPIYPVVPVIVTYDPSGTLTVTEGGGSPLWWADGGASEDGQPDWPAVSGTITGPTGPQGSVGVGATDLQVNGVQGYLTGTTTESGDTMTTTFSSNLIANEPWSYTEIVAQDPKGLGRDRSEAGYFAGSEPIVTVPHHGSVRDHVSEADQLDFVPPSVGGIAKGDALYGSQPALTATGLPPGIRYFCNRGKCELTGTPTRTGSYTVMLTASIDGVSASSSFNWQVAPAPPAPLPEVVTDLSPNDGIQRRPAVIGISADGSWWFGGATGHAFERRTGGLHNLGHLRWTSYNANRAYGRGVVWGLYGPGSLGSDREFQREGTVSVYEYRPVNGVFTRELVSGHTTFREDVTLHRTKLVHYSFHQLLKPQESDGRWYP
jgi:hypothetical protein